jgi:LacI family transcriptional regulator
MPRVTTTDIARKLKVAQPTVSTILNGSRSNTRVSNDLRQRILRVAAEMGYRPNSAAIAMKRGRFNAIGILSSTLGHHGMVPQATLWTMQQELMARDMHLVLGQMPDDKLVSDQDLPKVLREWSVDGLLLSYTADLPLQMLQLLRKYRIPAIHLNVRLAHDCVRPDDEGAAGDATRRLLAMGHRRIAYIGMKPRDGGEHYSILARRQGYELAMVEAGLTPRWVDGARDLDLHANDGIARQLLADADRPTAVLCYSAASAKPLLFAAVQHGLVPGRDLSVMTFSESRQEVLGPYHIDFMRIPFGPVGREAVKMLLQKAEHPGAPLSPVILPFCVEPGDTVGPPPRKQSGQS